MDTEPYISTVDDLDKFLEEMDTEVIEQVTPKKSNKVCHLYTHFFYKNRKCEVTLEILSDLFFFTAYEEIKKKIAAMYKPNW